VASGVLIFAEQREGVLKSTSFECVTLGKKLLSDIGGDLSVVLIGSAVSNMASEFESYGVDKIYMADDSDLNYYDGGRYSEIIVNIIKEINPSVFLASASSMGKDITPRIASSLDVGLAVDCTSVEFENGKVIATRPIFAGKANIKVDFENELYMFTIRPNVFVSEPADSKTPEVINVDTGSDKEPVSNVEHIQDERPELTEASIIVSGGRGMGGPENFNVTEELADELGAAIGASRAVVDAGWRPHSEQVGQTGKTVSPNLYIACGISGAIQHIAGMSSSKVIVAVNKDADAPIFKIATYGIVGDLFEVVPKMVEHIKKLKG